MSPLVFSLKVDHPSKLPTTEERHISFGSTHHLPPFSDLPGPVGLGKGELPLTCVKPSSGQTADASCCPSFYLNHGCLHCSWRAFWLFSLLVPFIFTGGLQKTKFFATIPRVEMLLLGNMFYIVVV